MWTPKNVSCTRAPLKKTLALYFVYGPTTYTKFVSTFFFQIIIKQTLNFQVEES